MRGERGTLLVESNWAACLAARR